MHVIWVPAVWVPVYVCKFISNVVCSVILMDFIQYFVKMIPAPVLGLSYFVFIAVGDEGQENITQIMWPSSYSPDIRTGTIYNRLHNIAKAILGDDMVFDFDMIISKVIE